MDVVSPLNAALILQDCAILLIPGPARGNLSRFHIVTRPGEVTSGVAEFGAGRPTAAPEVRKAWHHVTGSRDLRSIGPGIAWPPGGGGGGGV